MKTFRYFILMCLYILCTDTFAQDSTKVFKIKAFMQLVLNYHPVAQQYNLLSDMGKLEIRLARGNFDPKLESEIFQKVFKGKTYYGYIDNGLKVPLWFGSDLKFGYENNTGSQVNPTDYTPPGGLMYAGIHIPIGQGMIIDERRAAVKQAQAMQGMLEAEKIKSINKLLFSASKAYWEWYFQFEKFNKIQKSYQLASQRQAAISERAKQGDMATIDSTESFITLQERTVQLQDVRTDLNNARILLSGYLWKENYIPLEIDTTLYPENNSNSTLFEEAEIKKIIEQLPQTSPEILKLDNKIKQLEVEKKLYQDKLKPNLDFTYKYLTSPNNNYLNDMNFNYISNNYKIMLTISQPLFIRKERAKFQMSKIKINQTNFELLSTNRDISNLIYTTYNEIKYLEKALIQQQKINENYQILLKGEQSKFDNGESSVFMLNSRESKLIDGEIKLAELKSKLEKMKTELYYNAGNLNSIF